MKVFSTSDFTQVATIPVGNLPHGIWPSGDGTRVYVGLENDDKLVAIDTLSNRIIATTPIGQAPQAVVYVPGAVTQGDGTPNLQPLGVAGQAVHLALTSISSAGRDKSRKPACRCSTKVSCKCSRRPSRDSSQSKTTSSR